MASTIVSALISWKSFFLNLSRFRVKSWSGKMTQRLKCLLRMPDNLSADPQTHTTFWTQEHKLICNPSMPQNKRQKTCPSLVGQLVWLTVCHSE